MILDQKKLHKPASMRRTQNTKFRRSELPTGDTQSNMMPSIGVTTPEYSKPQGFFIENKMAHSQVGGGEIYDP